MKPRYYYSNTYRQRFYFMIGAKPESVIKFIKKTFGYDFEGSFEDCDGQCITVTDGEKFGIIIWTRKKASDKSAMPDIAHECLHAANHVLKSRGVVSSYDNDEPQTYFLSELMEQALGLTKQPKP